MICLCRHHHMLVHDRGYLIAAGPGGAFTFYDPGGTVIPPSPPLPHTDPNPQVGRRMLSTAPEMILEWLVPWCGYDDDPGVAPGSRVRGLSAGAGAWGAVAWGLGACEGLGERGVVPCAGVAGGWQGADGGEDGGQQDGAGGQAHDQLPAVADQPGGGEDERPPQGGDHRLAAAGAVSFQQLAAADQPGELVQPGGDGGGDQRRPHPRGVDLLIARGQVPQRGAVLAVAEYVLDAGAVPVPVLARHGPGRGGDIDVGQDEAVGVDSGFLRQLGEQQVPLI